MRLRDKVYWIAGLGGLTAGLVYLLSGLFAVLGGSLVLAWLLAPSVRRVEARWSLRRESAIGLIFLGIASACVLLLVVGVPLVAAQFAELSSNLGSYLTTLKGQVVQAQAFLEGHLGRPIPIRPDEVLGELERTALSSEEGIPSVLSDSAPSLGRWATAAASKVLAGGIGFLLSVLNLSLVPVFAFYLLRDWERIGGAARAMIPLSWRPLVTEMLDEIDQRLSAFVKGQLTVCLALAVLYSTGLLISGIDLAIPVGVGAGMLFIVPYLGTAVGVVLASLLALFRYGVDWHLGAAIGTFVGAQLVEGFVLTPLIVGDKVGLHPLVVMLALIVGGNLFGVTGMLLAIPVTAAAEVLLRAWIRSYRASGFFGGGAR